MTTSVVPCRNPRNLRVERVVVEAATLHLINVWSGRQVTILHLWVGNPIPIHLDHFRNFW